MVNKDVIPIVVTSLVVFLLIYFVASRVAPESFSTSGLALSDKDCVKLAEVYYKPSSKDPHCRSFYKDRICGKTRRGIMENRRGNYFTDHGVLI